MSEQVLERPNQDLVAAVEAIFRDAPFDDIPPLEPDEDDFILTARIREKHAYDAENFQRVLLIDGLFLLDDDEFPNQRIAILVINESTKDETVLELNMDDGYLLSYKNDGEDVTHSKELFLTSMAMLEKYSG